MNMNPLGRQFHSDYSWEVLGGLPANEAVLTFPQEWRGFSEGLVVRVAPQDGVSWVGNFRKISDSYINGVYSTPGADTICVVAGGEGYLVGVSSPRSCAEVPSVPIIDVLAIDDPPLLLLESLTDLSAVGRGGLAWSTARISWDGMKILSVSSRTLMGQAWDPGTGTFKDFSVNLRTGTHEGGSYS